MEHIDEPTAGHMVGGVPGRYASDVAAAVLPARHVALPALTPTEECLQFEPALLCLLTVHLHVYHPVVVSLSKCGHMFSQFGHN